MQRLFVPNARAQIEPPKVGDELAASASTVRDEERVVVKQSAHVTRTSAWNFITSIRKLNKCARCRRRCEALVQERRRRARARIRLVRVLLRRRHFSRSERTIRERSVVFERALLGRRDHLSLLFLAHTLCQEMKPIRVRGRDDFHVHRHRAAPLERAEHRPRIVRQRARWIPELPRPRARARPVRRLLFQRV